MHKFTQTIRKTVLYVTAVVLVGGVPMTAYADDSDACAGTGHWSKRWVTDPSTGLCVKLYDSKGNFVGPSYMAPIPDPGPDTPTPPPTPADTTQPNDSTSPGQVTVDDNGDANSTGVTSSTDAASNTTDNNTTTVNNTIKADSTSGSAGVSGNQSSGNAGTGNASADTTIVNSVHSTVDGNTGVAHFTANVNGDVIGDITINANNGPIDVTNSTTVTSNTDITNTAHLNNDVDMNATSGDASVKGNESQGNAASGNTNTVASIINLINTVIAANQSFVGTINIYGNLNGDILMSPEFIPQLIASNGGSVTSTTNLALATNVNDDASIINNVKLSAASGTASVSGNESSGSATTGTAQTNLTVLNLTGHTVNAANSLLIFVNVLGTWVGMIVDAPGATAAAFGSGVISDTTNVTGNTNINNNSRITNNVNLASQSGNASVSGNESAGNATSGNATASANIANVSTSTFNLSSWFGVLFINVFGSWAGSFGVDTEAGTIAPLSGMAVPDTTTAATIAPNLHFGFVPKKQAASPSTALSGTIGNSGSDSLDPAYTAAVLASAKKNGNSTLTQPVITPLASPREDPFSVIMMVTGFTIAGGSGVLWIVRRWLEYRSAATI